jgi:hypothetical protein
MAAPLRSRALHAKPPAAVYNAFASLQQADSGFPRTLRHDSGYGATGYEPREHRHADAQHHINDIGMDPCAAPAPARQPGLATSGHDAGPYAAGSYHSSDGTLQIPNTAPAEHFDMLPPLSSTHASWQALHDYAQSHASEHGYALSINTTAKNRSRIKLACVCYGQPKNTHKLTAETRIRKNRVSYKTGCKMWVEGKKQEDGMWLLRVGEPQHNHAGRPSEGWAVQRKRTWGVVGGRIGVGGVTAKEELARLGGANNDQTEKDEDDDVEGEQEPPTSQKPSHSLERGGLVWEIVEQEMLRKGEPSATRDRGVGRTVEVLQARLPGIHIFKRDVYNIRAQIKRARKAAGQQIGDGVISDNGEGAEAVEQEEVAEEENEDGVGAAFEPTKPSISPSQPNDHINSALLTIHTRDFAVDPTLRRQEPKTMPIAMPSHLVLSASSAELEQLRKEVTQLKAVLGEKKKEVKEKDIEIAGLRTQLEYMTSMAMLPS